MRLYCMEGYQNCKWPPTKPDPRSPPLELGEDVLCPDCYRAACDELIEEHERAIEELQP